MSSNVSNNNNNTNNSSSSSLSTMSTLQDMINIEKPTQEEGIHHHDDLMVTSPIPDRIIRKIRLANNNNNNKNSCYNVLMRSSKTEGPPNNNNNNSEPVIKNGQNNNYNVNNNNNDHLESALIADKYQLFEQVIGSSLFRCVNVKNKEELVCKVVSRDNHSLISAHYRLDNQPHIQEIHEVVVGHRYLYLIFPNAHGDLHSYVRHRKRLRETEAKKLFRQIVETVQLCHRNGIVLRDLKLRKFVFADPEQSELKLESFEDAVVLDQPESDWLHDKRGCPAYVSPEILKAGQYSGKGADMWSLGVILYTMLVGRYPFNDPGHVYLFARISNGSYVIPECVSPRARCLIRSLLRREPSERISSEDILHHPWFVRKDREWVPRSCDQMVPDVGGSLFDD